MVTGIVPTATHIQGSAIGGAWAGSTRGRLYSVIRVAGSTSIGITTTLAKIGVLERLW